MIPQTILCAYVKRIVGAVEVNIIGRIWLYRTAKQMGNTIRTHQYIAVGEGVSTTTPLRQWLCVIQPFANFLFDRFDGYRQETSFQNEWDI